MKRAGLALLLVVAAAAGVAVWVATSQPEWYQRVRYPLRYEAIVREHGYAVSAADVAGVRDEADFLALVERAVGAGE